MDFTDDAIVLSARRHGEANLVLSALTREHGRHLGLVKGGASRRQRPLLEIGNLLKVTWRARLEEQLGNFTVEPLGAAAATLLDDPLRLACLSAACAVADIVLPEREPHEDVYLATAKLIEAIAARAETVAAEPAKPEEGWEGGWATEDSRRLESQTWPAARWLAAYVRWELALLASLGFGLDLSKCAATGETADLLYVSPKTGRAVSRAAGQGYVDRLLPLPRFLIDRDATPDPSDILAGLRLTGYFLDRHVLHGPQAKGSATDRRLEARGRFLERLADQARS